MANAISAEAPGGGQDGACAAPPPALARRAALRAWLAGLALAAAGLAAGCEAPTFDRDTGRFVLRRRDR